LKKPARKSVCIIFIVTLVILVVFFWTNFSLVVVASGSMKPTLQVGDLLLVRRYATPKIGDIIVFRSPLGYSIVHRVIEKYVASDRVSFKTKGDANPSPDPWDVPESDVEGVVVFRVPYVGYLSLSLELKLISSTLFVCLLLYCLKDLFKSQGSPRRWMAENCCVNTRY